MEIQVHVFRKTVIRRRRGSTRRETGITQPRWSADIAAGTARGRADHSALWLVELKSF